MADLNKLQTFLEKSIDTPLLQADPSYLAVKSDIPNLITQIASEEGYSIEELPKEMERLVLLLAKKELYFRLAVTQAPTYDAETEFGKVLKGKRFDHYIKLVEFVIKDIEQLRQSGQLASIKVAEVTMRSRDGSYRNYALAKPQTNIRFAVSNITNTSVDLDWTIFDMTKGNFSCYRLLIGTGLVYDPYEDEPLNINVAERDITVTDIHRTKLRIKNLLPATSYNIALIYKGINGSETVLTATATTLV